MNVANVTVDLKGEISNSTCMDQIQNAYLSGKVSKITTKYMIFCNYCLSSMSEMFVILQIYKRFYVILLPKTEVNPALKLDHFEFSRLRTSSLFVDFCTFWSEFGAKRLTEWMLSSVESENCDFFNTWELVLSRVWSHSMFNILKNLSKRSIFVTFLRFFSNQYPLHTSKFLVL